MKRLPQLIYGVIIIIANWFGGYFLLLNGPQDGHGNVEFLLARSYGFEHDFLMKNALSNYLNRLVGSRELM
jgi:hypothetical protein